MPTEKERFEILMEHVVNKIDIVAEGHGILVNKIDTLDRKIDDNRTELINMIKTSNKILHEKIDNVEIRLNEKIDNVKTELKAEVAEVKAEVAEVKAEVAEVKAEVAEVKAEVAGVKAEVAGVKAEVAGVKIKVTEVEKKLTQEISDVKKSINKVDVKLTHVLERQDVQEERTEKIYQKVFAGK